MTVFLRSLHGPFKRRHNGEGRADEAVTWHFFGVRDDQSMGFWHLNYSVLKRTFAAASAKQTSGAPVTNPDLFIPDAPMLYGPTLTAILKSRLSPEDLAFAAAASLKARK
jgi:hypothetical protein